MGVGIGEAGGVAPSYALIADYFEPRRRARALAIFSLGVPIGLSLGTLIGAYIAHAINWRAAFYIMGVAGRVNKPRTDFHWAHGPITRVAGYHAKDIVFGQAGIKPEDVHVTGSYDAFTFTTMLQLEEYGFCKKGEGGQYVSSGIIELGGKRPNNTSGSHLCEGYTHGISMVIENVRQLRGQVDDYCPGWEDGKHSYDYSPGKCRQVKDARVTMNLGWAMPPTGSALIMRS